METTIGQEIAALQQMNQHELRDKYIALFGEETRSGNRVWIIKRMAWRLQALVEGGLSERARQRAVELANDTEVRTTIPQTESPRRPRTPRSSPASAMRVCPCPAPFSRAGTKASCCRSRFWKTGSSSPGPCFCP